MAGYVARRIGYALLTLWVVVTLTFLLMHTMPGQPFNDPERLTPIILANLDRKYGLNKPIWEQYVVYLNNIIHGDLGTSYRYENESVNHLIATRFPVSLQLGLEAMVLAVTFGALLGVVAALHRNRTWDYVATGVALIGLSVPSLVLGPILSYYVGVKLQWLPSGLWDSFSSTILPAITLALLPLAYIARLMRATMLDVLREEYILVAKAKGVDPIGIVVRHVARNAMVPLITVISPMTVSILTGSIVVEQTFAIPGLGQYYITAILDKDYTVIMGTTLFYAALYIASLLLTDLLYGIVDPRIRIAKGGL